MSPLRAPPTATSRTLWQLDRTRSLAIKISKPAAPSNSECEAHGVSSLLTAEPRKTLSQGTNDRPLHLLRPPVWPFLGGRPTPDTCALSSSWQPSNAAQSVSAVPRRAVPSQCNVDINDVSIANCAPPNNGNPSPTISNRRASPRFGAAKSVSWTMSSFATNPLTASPPRNLFFP